MMETLANQLAIIINRQQAEEKLKRSEEKFSKIFHVSPLIKTISRVADGRIIDVNEMFVKSSGYTRQEVIDQSIFDLDVWTDISRRDRMNVIARQNGGVENFEMDYRSKSGKVIHALTSLEFMKMGEEEFVINSTVDITDRKLAEEALRESENRFRTTLENMQINCHPTG